MRRFFGGVSVMMLGAALAVGCGGSSQEDKMEAQPPGAVTETAPDISTPASKPGLESDDVSLGEDHPGQVGAAGVCCNVKCSGTWYGPFPGVHYDVCHNYGVYYCKERGKHYESHAWKNC